MGLDLYGPGATGALDGVAAEQVRLLNTLVDNMLGAKGLMAKAVATTNVALSGLPVIDGYQTVADDQVLLTGQTDAKQNGPWVVGPGAWSRPPDFAAGAILTSRAVMVTGGGTRAGSIWVLNASTIVDTTAQTWTVGAVPPPGTIVDAQVAAAAGIQQSKILNLVADLAGKQAVIPPGTYAKPATSGTLAARPAATVVGQRYLATDTDGGTHYESLNGTTWTQLAAGVASVPKVGTQTAVGAEVDLFRVNLATAARGPFRFHVEDGIFNGERDPRLVIGYNQAAEGGLLKAGEPAFSWCIEAHYYDGTNRTFEGYWQYVGSTGSPVRRPIFIQIIKSTNAMNAFQIRSSGIDFTDWAMAGDVVIAQIANAPAQMGIRHYGRSDQTVDTELVAEAQNGKAGLLKLGAAPGTGGAFQVRRVNNNQWAMDASGFAGMFEFFGPDGTRMYGSPTFAGLGILSPTDIPTLILVARAAQTTNLLQARASDGTSVLWAITAAGLPKWHAASSVQTTVGAAGTAAAPPANPTKWLKVVGDDNLTYVVAAYAAA